MNVTFATPTPHPETTDYAFAIVARAIGTLEDRLRSRGCNDPLLIADLAVSALAERLDPVEAVRLANSSAATAAVRRLSPKSVRFPRPRGSEKSARRSR